MPTLHLHFDESGNWHFTPKGSKYFVMAAAWTFEPEPLAHALTTLRFQLLSDGMDLDSFHASPDRQPTRDAVISSMVATPGWSFAAVVLEKRKINPVLREPQRFYPKFAGTLLRFVLKSNEGWRASKILVYTDTIAIEPRRKREGAIKAMKTTCAECKPNAEHHVYSHRRESNPWLQVADYCAWAVYKKWESEDTRSYDQLRSRLALPELNLTARGDQSVYY